MGTKVKGLLRGLRYISQIFDEKEPEMEIGFPTDVKHVAHIGWDGPSASTPSWMNEFKGPSDPATDTKKSESEECATPGEKTKAKPRRPPSSVSGSSNTAGNRQGRRHQAGGSSSPVNSPKSCDAPKQSRRRRSASNLSVDSPVRDSSSSSRSSRHHPSSSIQGSESPAHEQASIPKHSRGRKSKGSGGGSSKGSSKSKEHNYSEDSVTGDSGVVASQTT